MKENETAGASTPARESNPSTLPRVPENDPLEKSTAALLFAARALPVGGAGFCVTPAGAWWFLERLDTTTARAVGMTEAGVVEAMLAEARFIEAEPLGGPA